MLSTDELFLEVMSLPIEMRMALVNKLLKSLNPAQSEIDIAWAEEAERRIAEVESGKAQLIPGEEVFAKIRKKYKL